MRKIYFSLIVILIITMSFSAINYLEIFLPITPYNYANIPFPSDVVSNLSQMDNTPADNPITDDGATLGRVLFYDVELSKNRTVSCASCHQQKFSFSDTARFSKGFNGGLTGRNSMGLIHARFQRDSAFFWDNRASSLEIQTLIPIQNSVEMGLTLDTMIARLSAKPYYAQLFQAAFGTPTVTSDRVSKALAQFVRSMNTFGSKFRQGVEATTGNPSVVPLVNFTAQENLGKDLFMDITRGNCQACHTRNVMVQQGAQNIGLDLVYADNGVGAASGNSNKNGQFSVPSLINIALTPPYMHDGRFKTLEQVIDFYSDSIKAHPNLSGFLREIIPGTVNPNNNQCDTCAPRKPHFTPTEKAALVAFLKTLTDTIITNDVRWSNPFVCGSHNVQTVQSCESYSWNGTTYTNSGVYVNSYINSTGCVSADTLKLTINRGTHNSSTISSCDRYTWNGTTYTNSGNYTFSYNNNSGCPSVDTLHLTIKTGTHNTTITSACNSYIWNGNTYTSSGVYVYNYTNALGCASADTLKLTINQKTNSTTNTSVCSNALPYVWNGTSYNAAGTYTKVLVNNVGCDSTAVLNLSINNVIPATPSTLTQTLVQNLCGNKIYRYTVGTVTNATGYKWLLPTSVGGATGVFVDSGDVNNSSIIKIRYSSNAAAGNTDSIKVSAVTTCGSSVYKGFKLTNTLLTVPAAPTTLNITAVSATTCGNRIYRYSTTSTLPAATATSAAATGFSWSFTGTLGANASIDSGTLSSSTIRIKFTSSAAAANGDSVRVAFTSACGNSANKSSKLTNTAIQSVPVAPASITITDVSSNTCSARIYRYIAPALTSATSTTLAATGYLWSFTGTLGNNAVLDSGTLTSRTIRIKFTSNAAAANGDSVRVAYASSCGYSANKSVKLSNTLLLPPTSPTTLTQTLVSDVCGARVYRYTVTAVTNAIGYAWTIPNSVGGVTGVVVDSGNISSSRIIRLKYTSNSTALPTDSIKVASTSACGNSVAKGFKLTNISKPGCPTPLMSELPIAFSNPTKKKKERKIVTDEIVINNTTAQNKLVIKK